MAEADQTFRDSLAAILRYPEVQEHLRRLEAQTVDMLALETNQDNILERVRVLKVIRSFAKGAARTQDMKDLKESGYKPRVPDDDDNQSKPAARKRPAKRGQKSPVKPESWDG